MATDRSESRTFEFHELSAKYLRESEVNHHEQNTG
jgi:hypothetical protein